MRNFACSCSLNADPGSIVLTTSVLFRVRHSVEIGKRKYGQSLVLFWDPDFIKKGSRNTRIIRMPNTGDEDEVFDLKFYTEPDFVAPCLEYPVYNEHKVWQAWAQGQKPRAIYDSTCPERFSARHFAEAQHLVLPVLLERKLDEDATAYLTELLLVKDVKVCRIAGIYQQWQEFALDSMQVSDLLMRSGPNTYDKRGCMLIMRTRGRSAPICRGAACAS